MNKILGANVNSRFYIHCSNNYFWINLVLKLVISLDEAEDASPHLGANSGLNW